ncbi:TlpA family protein disulfide reductase [Streptomyces sp. PTM05]|uniref:TlpA family protein disulfide reductase n=1 Tax=Streptantibioticus parmotrematis TaxID=2873249 RepID=A0ABS7R3I1_9ACTN|nr:TlpA disulfide reductase family protein [Streptantibioticus parmotrematis]MBY8888599.1 TlpA family protein disulfide reductase [Streptantibioticus parmotrematis]
MSLPRVPHPRPRHRAAAALATGTALVLALAGCSAASGGSASNASGTSFVQSSKVITTVPQGKRPTAPDISGTTVDGTQLSLDRFKGKVVVLNVWGSWCDPCRAEAPNLAQVSQQDAAKGVQFVGINIRDYSTAQSKSFERSFGITYPSFYDPEGKLLVKFPNGSLPPQSIPTTLIIDRHGKIAVRALEALSTDQLNKALDPIIAEK